MNKKVLIGMSGGVDSSVAAYLLKNQGYEVYGATMRLHDYTASAEKDAQAICKKLGIDFSVFDLRDKFKQHIIDNFVNEYKGGRTPNPCIVCNKYIKFGAFLDIAKSMNMDLIATGHYAKNFYNNTTKKHELHASPAQKKDQSYFLYNFTQHSLSHTLLPLGNYAKDEIRKIADNAGFTVANKPDSQEICFICDDDYPRFICEYCGDIPKTGKILDTSGNILGEHKGLIYYTVGQRKGIGAYGRPMFVKTINPTDNTIILGEKGMEFSNTLIASNLNFISGEFPKNEIKIQAKHRYQAPASDALLIPANDDSVKVIFDEPQRAITPGQSVVFYDNDIVLGGGIIM